MTREASGSEGGNEMTMQEQIPTAETCCINEEGVGQQAWLAVRCDMGELPRRMKLMEDAGYRVWRVLLEHSEYTILAYLTVGERERLGIKPMRADRNPYSFEPSEVQENGR